MLDLTVLANLGKMVPTFCTDRRPPGGSGGLAVGMWPVVVVGQGCHLRLGYGIGGR